MADLSPTRRKFYIHAAHRTVGVSGCASSFRTDCSGEFFSDDAPSIDQTCISLVSSAADSRSQAGMAAFERILLKRGNVRCRRRSLAHLAVEGLADADCAVVFGRGGLQIVSHWSAFDADGIMEDRFEVDAGSETKIEVAAASRWHPVVDGISPFLSRTITHSSHLRQNVIYLLVRRWEGQVLPVAWVRQGEKRAFCTLLGQAEDFCQREFVRLLLNAIDWIRQ